MDENRTNADQDVATPVVYALYRDGDANIYVGSTNNLHIRMQCHKAAAANPKCSQLLYTYARTHGSWSEWKLEVLEHLAGAHTSPFHRKVCEQRWIDELQPTLNSQKASTGLPSNLPMPEYKRKYYQSNKQKYKASSTSMSLVIVTKSRNIS